MTDPQLPPSPEQQQEAKAATRAAFWTRLAVLVAAVYVLGSTAALIYLGVQGGGQRQRLIDCTTPGHGCYDDANKQTAQVVLGLLAGGKQNTIDVVTAALSCQADGITDIEPLARCTIERSKP